MRGSISDARTTRPHTKPLNPLRVQRRLVIKGLVKTSTTTHSPKIAPEYLLKRTARQLISSAILCWVWISLTLAVVTEVQLAALWRPVLLIASAVSCFALMRNRILDRIYRRISFATHYQLKVTLAIPFSVFLGMVIGLMLFGRWDSQREILGPIVAVGLVICSILWSIGPMVSDKSEASLLLTQCIYEIGKENKIPDCFRWLDRGLYKIIRILRQYGIRVHGPTLRLGARLYCLERKTNLNSLLVLSKAIMKMEESEPFRELRAAVEALTDTAEKAIARGVSPQPRIVDYLDFRYLSLKNVYQMLGIILAILAILISITTGHLSLR